MARITANPTTRGFSGKFGDAIVFRTMRGNTFVSPVARKPAKSEQSEAQRNTRVTFREASVWAQHILLDESKKAYYQQRAKALKLPNAYTAALTDYMRKGKIETSAQRNVLFVAVRKPGFKLANVDVTTEDNFQPRIKLYPRALGWQIEAPKPPEDTSYSLTITITDYFGRVRVEVVDVVGSFNRGNAIIIL